MKPSRSAVFPPHLPDQRRCVRAHFFGVCKKEREAAELQHLTHNSFGEEGPVMALNSKKGKVSVYPLCKLSEK